MSAKNVCLSLHFQTRSGHLCRGGTYCGAALRLARIAIRSRGFTLLQAWQHETAEARRAWLAAERVAMRYWDKIAPPGCPRAPEIRLVLARRE